MRIDGYDPLGDSLGPLYVGETRRIFALARFENSSSETFVAATWSSSRPEIARITASDTTGTVTALSSGSTVITASYLNMRQSVTFDVRPDLTGVWRGSYVLSSCTDYAQLRDADWCRQLGGSVRLPMTLGLGPNQNYRFAPIGVLALGSIPFNVSFTTTTDGTARGSFTSALRATFPFVFNDPVFYNTAFRIDLHVENGQITSGNWSLYAIYDGGKGTAQMQGESVTLVRDPGAAVLDANAFPPATSVANLIDRLKR